MNLMAAVREWGRFVQFSQTAWALPFGLAAMVVAARDQAGWPGLRVFGLVLIAMVSARTCAVAFNQIVDREHDRLNPRTAGRSLPAGRVTAVEAWGVCAAGAIGLVAASYFLNRICFFLSPVALLVICSYSLARRWTDYTHLVLGVAMAMAPLGAWLAVRGTLGISVVVLALAVVFWHVGFDIMDSLQDYEFDRRHGLRSLVVAWGAAQRAPGRLSGAHADVGWAGGVRADLAVSCGVCGGDDRDAGDAVARALAGVATQDPVGARGVLPPARAHQRRVPDRYGGGGGVPVVSSVPLENGFDGFPVVEYRCCMMIGAELRLALRGALRIRGAAVGL